MDDRVHDELHKKCTKWFHYFLPFLESVALLGGPDFVLSDFSGKKIFGRFFLQCEKEAKNIF